MKILYKFYVLMFLGASGM